LDGDAGFVQAVDEDVEGLGELVGAQAPVVEGMARYPADDVAEQLVVGRGLGYLTDGQFVELEDPALVGVGQPQILFMVGLGIPGKFGQDGSDLFTG
jgi:hypothetical protein